MSAPIIEADEDFPSDHIQGMMESIYFPVIDVQEHNKKNKNKHQHIKKHQEALNKMLLTEIMTLSDMLKKSDDTPIESPQFAVNDH